MLCSRLEILNSSYDPTCFMYRAILALACCHFLYPNMCAAETGFPAEGAVTERFISGRRGYSGLLGIWLAEYVPDKSINRTDLLVGRVYKNTELEWRSLVSFTDLQLPPASKIISANLILNCSQISGKPKIAVYGLLRDFKPAAAEWGEAKPGESTWNSQIHGRTKWGKPGADSVSSTFEYDGKADRFGKPDSTIEIGSTGKIVFDVTRSFASQLAADKEYGWLLLSLTKQPETLANFAKHQAELKVTYSTPGDSRAHVTNPLERKLISFRLAEAYAMAENLPRLQAMPYKGAVFLGAGKKRLDGGRTIIANSVFGPDPIDASEFSEFVEDIGRIQRKPSPLQHNFLRINLTVPGTLKKLDKSYTWDTRPRGDDKVSMWWADGFDAVLHNTKVAAQLARKSGMKGLLLDWETYGGNIWSMEYLEDAAGRSLEKTRAQVRVRAHLFTQVLNESFPEMTLIVIPQLYHHDTHLFWNDFCDELIVACDPRMRIINGNESGGYQAVSENEFQKLYDAHYSEALKHSSVPQKFRRQTAVGFGLWLNWKGWSETPEIHSSSAEWQTKIENAMRVSDTYIWVFTGGTDKVMPDWWTGNNLPDAYLKATRRGLELGMKRQSWSPRSTD